MSYVKNRSAKITVRVTVDEIDPSYDTPELRQRYVTPFHAKEMEARAVVHAERILESLSEMNIPKYLNQFLEIEAVSIFKEVNGEEILLAEYWNPKREKKKEEWRKCVWGFSDACMNGADPNEALQSALKKEVE